VNRVIRPSDSPTTSEDRAGLERCPPSLRQEARGDAQPVDRSQSPPRGAWGFAQRLVSQFIEDDAMTLAAAIAFYTALSLAPIIVIILALAGAVWGQEAASKGLIGEIDQLVGRSGAELTEQVIEEAAKSEQTGLAAVIGIATLLFAATTLFAQLQYSLNRIWDVKPKPGRGLLTFLRKRLLSLGMVLALGFLLLVSLAASAGIHAATQMIRGDLPGQDWIWQAVNIAASFVVFTLVFAAMYKALPDAKVWWRTVWVGAAVTAALFIVGKQLIGLYLGRGSVGSAYGAAGSLLVVLAWVYYSSLIFFFGAEFTQVYAARTGHEIEPSKNAVRESRS